MNYSKYDSKNEPRNNNAGHPSVTLPTTPDANKGKSPVQGDERKGNEAKHAVPASGSSDTGNQAMSNGQDHNPAIRANGHASTSGDKADSAAMVNEGGHASPGKTPGAVREPDASVAAQNEPSKGSVDGAADKSGLSAKSDR